MSREDTVSASVDHVLVTIAIWLGCGVAAALAMLALGVLVGRALRANSAPRPDPGPVDPVDRRVDEWHTTLWTGGELR